VDLSSCHLEFIPETVFVNTELRTLNLRHNVIRERPLEEDIYTIGWLDDIPRYNIFIVFTSFHAGRPPSLFLRAAHAHSPVPGGQNAFSNSAFRCIPVYFAHRAQLNAHARPVETDGVGRKNDDDVHNCHK
jgi:hypothetical protein